MQAIRGRLGRRGTRLVGVGVGLVITSGLAIGTATPSQGAECPPDRPLCRLFTTAASTTTTTKPPAPIVAIPTLPPVTVAPPPPAPPAAPRSAPEAAQRLLDLVNGERAKAGLGRLTSRGDVVEIALAHSHRMAAAGNIFHNDTYFTDTVRRLLNTQARGENVAQNSFVDDTHTRLMNSPGHRANILDPRFSVAGFAVVQAADGRYYTTQNFLQPAGAPASAAPAAPAAPRSRSAAAPKAAPAPATTTPAPVVEPVAVTTPVAPASGAELAALPVAPAPAPAAFSSLPDRRIPTAWLPAVVLLVLAALGTFQLGRQTFVRVPLPR